MSRIDWSRPIEAVHDDGRVVAVTLSTGDGPNPDRDGDYITTPVLNDGSNLFHPDGANWSGSPWRIRNVAQPTPERDPALWDRMEALVREMALRDNGDGTVSLFKIREHVDAAMSIVVALPKPVEADLAEARKIALSFALPGKNGISTYATNRGDADNGDEVQAILAAIKRGRALAAQGAARG